jgi:hypothetical protein
MTLRTHPVSRAEVRLIWSAGKCCIATYPFDACRTRPRIVEKWEWETDDTRVKIERTDPRRTFYEPIPQLFEPLLAELRREWEEARERIAELRRTAREPELKWVRNVVYKTPPPGLPATVWTDNDPTESWARSKYHFDRIYRPLPCAQCGTVFVGRGKFCSDRCKNQWEPYQRTRREQNAAKSAARAEARSNRACERCGKPFVAARSDRRFCSATCRVTAARIARRALVREPAPQ